MRFALAALLAVACVGCASSWKSMSGTRVSSNLQAMEYNSVASDYRVRPTFVQLRENMGGDQVLVIKMDAYGTQDVEIYIPPSAATKVLEFIEKYEEWESLARERGDMITKEIGEVPNFTGMKLQAKFHSGNEQSHYLVLQQCVWVCELSDRSISQYFDRRQAENLKGLLSDYLSGDIRPLDEDRVYN